MQTLRRFLSASVDSQLTSAPNNLYACQLKKKLHNLKVENYVLFSKLAEDFCSGDSLSGLRYCSEEEREEPGHIEEFLQQKACM